MTIYTNVKVLDRFDKVARSKSKDAIIIHGMLSGAGNLRNLKNALEKRRCYRKVRLFDMPYTHKMIPYHFTESDAEELAEKIHRKINRNHIEKPVDVIGHSNGGYVALWLTKMLKGINYVFTIATPPRLYNDYGLSKAHFRKIIHIKGGCDFFNKTIGWDGVLTESEFVIEFPDEGHCSIHRDADSNGFADIISYLNGNDRSHCFIDKDNTLHIWPFCKYEIAKSKLAVVGSHEIKVCNGNHQLDNGMDTRNIFKYYYFRKDIIKKIKLLESYNNQLRPYVKTLKEESDALTSEIIKMNNRLSEFEKILKLHTSALLNDVRIKIQTILEPIELSIKIASEGKLDNKKLKLINQLLRLSNKNNRDFLDENISLFKKKSLTRLK